MGIKPDFSSKTVCPQTPVRALVLAGGGIPGWMYEVGCLTAMDDFFDGFSVNDFDLYVGTSAGAAVAALMANGIRPRAIYDDIKMNRKGSFNFRSKDIYSFGYQETFHILGKFFKSLPAVARYCIKHRNNLSLLEVLDLLQENLPSGIFTLKNMEYSLNRFFSQIGLSNDFRRLKKRLYIPAVDIDMGTYDVFGEEPFDDVPIAKAVTASSAIPFLFQPVRIGDKDYMDGGVGRVAHIDIAINHGAKLIWVVNPVQYIVNDRVHVRLTSLSGDTVGIKDKGLYHIYDQAMRINTNTRLYMAMRRYRAEHTDKGFFLIQPKTADKSMFSQNVISSEGHEEIVKYGYRSTMETLIGSYADYQNNLKPYGISITLDRFGEP